MAIRPWKKLSEQVVSKNPWWTYRLHRVLLPSGHEGDYHFVSNHGSAMVVAQRQDGRVVLVAQWRYVDGKVGLELPGGGLEQGGSAEQGARAELAQETGLAAERLERVGSFNPCTGTTDEICHVFVARGLSPAPPTPPDETEELEVVALLPAEVEERIRSGEIWDGVTIAAWHLARPHLEAPPGGTDVEGSGDPCDKTT